MATNTLEALERVNPVEGVVVDGTPARDLYPARQDSSRQSVTSRQIAQELGLNQPSYTRLHEHCQYMRRC